MMIMTISKTVTITFNIFTINTYKLTLLIFATMMINKHHHHSHYHSHVERFMVMFTPPSLPPC